VKYEVVWSKKYLGELYRSDPLPKKEAERHWVWIQNQFLGCGGLGFEADLEIREVQQEATG